MAKHEFGMMKKPPGQNEVYVDYKPEKYDCISVDDDYIQPLLEKLSRLDCYWHSLKRPEKGLTYTGITLIPPSSLEVFITVLDGATGTEELKALLIKAEEEGKYIIHYGL